MIKRNSMGNIGEPSLNPPEPGESFEEYIDSRYGGICPECNVSLDVESDHYQCGENRKDDIASEAAISAYEDRLADY